MWKKCVAGVFIVSLLLVAVPTFSEAIEQRKWKSSDEGGYLLSGWGQVYRSNENRRR